MAEPLKKEGLSREPETPQPFRNQEIRQESNGLDSLPPAGEFRVDTPASNVVPWRSAQTAADPAMETLAQTYQDIESSIADLANRSREAGREVLDRARFRFRYWAEEYPLQLFGAIAAVGFVAGALLRVWRSNRYEQ
ncbi:MAG TPA: hypothetical protein VFA68_02500 [Terriglobales bacterium]|nr:hypothetical protein [Terriglobales bacterium]